MISKQTQITATNPFVKAFALQIIKNLKEQKIYYSTREIIDAELVPRVIEKKRPSISEPDYKKAQFNYPIFVPKNLFSNTNRKRKIPLVIQKPIIKPKETISKRKFLEPAKTLLIKTHEPSKIISPPESPYKTLKEIPHPNISLPKVNVSETTKIPIKKESPASVRRPSLNLPREQEKLAPLLNDSSIYSIECSGAGKPIMVLRGGQKQTTKVILSEEEIKNFLKKISKETHIPLLGGIFRAISGNHSVNAVVSEIVGSKFVIKKHIF